jgi:hypothetical protein
MDIGNNPNIWSRHHPAFPRGIGARRTIGGRYPVGGPNSAYRPLSIAHPGSLVVPASCSDGMLMKACALKRRTHNVSTDVLGAIGRYAAFGPRSSTSVGVLGLEVCWLRLFLIRLLLSTPLCLCWLWLAWLGVASWVAPVVVAVE